MSQVNCIRGQRVVKVAHPLLIANATCLAIRGSIPTAASLLARRLVQVVVRVIARDGERLGHDG